MEFTIFRLIELPSVCRFAASLLLILGSVAHAAESQRPINVADEIWPLIQEKCLRCHGAFKAGGGLRLDRRSLMELGGHSGNPILGSVEESELLSRIRSDDELYRMPKDAAKLTAEEIALLERWVEEGASWPADQLLETPPVENPKSFEQWKSEAFERAVEIQLATKSLLIPGLAAMLLILVLQRRKRKLADGQREARTLFDRLAASFGLNQYVITMLVLALVAGFMLYRADIERVEFERKRYERQLIAQRGTVEGHRAAGIGRRVRPLIPPHPPRLGGSYYRGNDERNPELFNNGYYRTATMTLSLRDGEGNQLNWGDRVVGSIAVHLEIERAPHATPTLFRDGNMTSCCLRKYVAGAVANDDSAVPLKIDQSGQRWSAQYSIADASGESAEKFRGLVHVCDSTGNPHYGIEYELFLVDGTLESSSTLAMGATFQPGFTAPVNPNTVAPHQWFSFLPLPEIVGGNSSDPELLGVSEHQGKLGLGVDEGEGEQ